MKVFSKFGSMVFTLYILAIAVSLNEVACHVLIQLVPAFQSGIDNLFLSFGVGAFTGYLTFTFFCKPLIEIMNNWTACKFCKKYHEY